VRSTLPVLGRAAPIPGCLPEDNVCSAPIACADPSARAGTDDAHKASIVPVWEVDPALPGVNPALPVTLSDVKGCTPSAQKTEREPAPGHKGDCTRGTRSFVDVLECLL
jgi:hypothetical protein